MKKMLLFLFVGISLTSFSQKADFKGSWIINKDKIEWGAAPEWVLPRSFTIEQDKDKMNFVRTFVDDSLQEHPYQEALIFDGSETTGTTYSGSQRISSLKWNDDGQTFVLSTHGTRTSGESTGTATETWALQDEGKMLVIDRSVIQGNGMQYSIRAYYDKQ